MEWVNNLVDYGIIGFLIVLCFVVVMLSVERILFFRSVKTDSYKSRKELELDLQKNLPFIGTVASNSPYIGLLGTVLGIMMTFYNVGTSTKIDTGRIMVNLSLALKATAVGLVVAIIAVVLYNALSGTTKKMLTRWDISNEG
ncbi:TonB-system energizer ExbB [Seleniivibrio sp.]|uniref:TonB-system energizer ExbB n=1 Tax=Seleniivibrio sp. TaxID=2898801 RepID=UPI0025EFC50C|nr:TonB-system energizer ExbB [Seleniivibrio sp.]MCD8553574.1 TonB-system energizer ExbB [Seleniivibrio sp.]